MSDGACNDYSNQIEVLDPTYDEVVENIGRLKNHKSTGSDNIPAELIKYGGSLLYRELHKLILKIWQQEKIPDEWKKSVIIPIHKSGDKEHIENYRGISVVNTAYKVLSSLLLARLKPLAEDILGDYQCGFRGNRSTTDNIFAVKMINEKMWEFNRSVQYLFVDFSKAYDSIHRQSLWNIMKDFQIPAKLIRMCQVCMDENVSQVLINNQYSDPFSNRTGLRQGDGLSPLLFNLALEMVARKMRMAPAGIHLGDRHKIFAYADDIVLAGENELELRRLLVELVEAAARVGLTINQKKTKYLVLQRGQIREPQQFLRIGQYNFERVQCFKFLGVHIDDQNQRQTEMQIRLNNANKAYHSLRSLFSSRLLSRNSKLTLYNTIIKPVLLYGSETWSVTKREEHQMQVFENKVYRTIFGPYFDHQTQSWKRRHNSDIHALSKQPNIVATMNTNRLRWLGHLMRIDKNRAVWKIFTSTPHQGKRLPGRPRSCWINEMKRLCNRWGLNDWEELTQHRVLWRQAVWSARDSHIPNTPSE
ncbi:hypothetical protein M8J77_022853 [Diaphorina citri]|nr:hypothetical protein M8J77_022853 [Diaphorina citri]